MTTSIRKFLKTRKFNYLSLDLETSGDWSPNDSEWNYSDVLHFPHVHKVFDQKILHISNTTNSSYFMQNLFFLKNPIIIYQEHKTKDTHEYVSATYGVTISIITKHLEDTIGAKTITNYQFFYSGFFGFLVAYFARLMTKLNYKKVISEDMPMRAQRGKLRKSNKIDFKLDSKLISPLSTSNANDNNVSIKDNVSFDDTFEIFNQMTEYILEDVFLKVMTMNNILYVYPTICPHEGSPLKSNELEYRCQWHGRLIKPYYSFDFKKKSVITSFTHLNKNFSIDIFKKNNKFTMRLSLQNN